MPATTTTTKTTTEEPTTTKTTTKEPTTTETAELLYVFGETNSNSCPPGAARILTEDACKAATASHELSWGSTENVGEYPKGCYRYGSAASGQVWFNTHATGAADSFSTPLCQSGEAPTVAPTTAPTTTTAAETTRQPTAPPQHGPGGDCEDGDTMTTPPSVNGGCQRCTCHSGEWQCACSMRHRKEINDLTDAEFNKFAAAVNAMKADGSWAAMVQVHMESNFQKYQTHNSLIFLPWHRKFFIEVENRLQVALNDCSVTIPYWNWALEFSHFAESKVFSPSRLGSLNTHVSHGRWSDVEELCVTDGAFGSQNPNSSFGGKNNELTQTFSFNGGTGSDCIMRGGSESSGLSYSVILSHLEEHQGTEAFEDMARFIEQDAHNSIHGAIGGSHKRVGNSYYSGHMTTHHSPYDPIFFLHHGFVDYLWKQWQDHHLEDYERMHRSEDMMSHLKFDGDSGLGEYSVSDVAMSMDILDDDPSTANVREKACVYYHERETHHACAARWQDIQVCLQQVVDAKRLHDVPRIKEMTAVGDVCSPINPVHADEDRIWLETLVQMGMLDESEVTKILKWEHEVNMEIESTTPILDEKDATPCDKAVCFDTARLLEICDSL